MSHFPTSLGSCIPVLLGQLVDVAVLAVLGVDARGLRLLLDSSVAVETALNATHPHQTSSATMDPRREPVFDMGFPSLSPGFLASGAPVQADVVAIRVVVRERAGLVEGHALLVLVEVPLEVSPDWR